MTCYKKGDKLVIRGSKKKKWHVVFLKHDPDYPRSQAHVVYAFTRHVARVQLDWLERR